MKTQTKPTFTPGPWTVAKADADVPLFDVRLKGNESTDDTLVCLMYEPGPKGQQRANAALIAAAPDMFEAIGRIVDECTDLNFEQLCLLKDVLRKARAES